MNQEFITTNLQKYAYQTWLAGLGAFRTIEKEGGRLFERLVKEGEAVQARTKTEIHKDHTAKVKAKSKVVGYQQWLEQAVQDNITLVLHWLNIVTKEDIRAVSHRIDALEVSLQELKGSNKSRSTLVQH